MDVIAAVVLGGARITGGTGSVGGTLLGVILVTLINNVLILAGVPVSYTHLDVYKRQMLCGLVAAIAGIVIASRTSSAKWDFGSSYLMIAILSVVMAGVKPEGGYGRPLCLLFSATALQVMSLSLIPI